MSLWKRTRAKSINLNSWHSKSWTAVDGIAWGWNCEKTVFNWKVNVNWKRDHVTLFLTLKINFHVWINCPIRYHKKLSATHVKKSCFTHLTSMNYSCSNHADWRLIWPNDNLICFIFWEKDKWSNMTRSFSGILRNGNIT